MASELPPTYSQHDPDIVPPAAEDSDDPHILIIPAADSVNFQTGYLGSEGEHAAIEGELQVKTMSPRTWGSVSIALRTVECAYQREIELGFSEMTLFKPDEPTMELPSSFPFSIPLPHDTPQSLHTPTSSLSHTLIATVRPSDISETPFTKALVVHTKRYTGHGYTPGVAPETFTVDDPTRCQVQVPRTTFMAEENIPIYVTIPPPSRDLVVEQGVRLRNVRVELVRVIKVKRDDDDGHEESKEGEEMPSMDGPSSRPLSVYDKSANKGPKSPLFFGSTYRSTIARSGASCRFHSTRSVQLRFVLHQSNSPCSGITTNALPSAPPDNDGLDSDENCPSISQTTLLHSITFRLNVHIAFVDTSHHTERISSIKIPIEIIPPAAPLPEMDRLMDEQYAKKHDHPPDRTMRYDEVDAGIPQYSEGEAGPSAIPHAYGAPPPFEERDAPPPFFPSTSSRLPTFLEAESEIIIPPQEEDEHPPQDEDWLVITGEGTEFGFHASQQFDGHADELELRPSTPPPTLEMSDHDTNLTELTDIDIHSEPEHAMEVLGRALEQHNVTVVAEDVGMEESHLPPPPPALDDPSDPPPSIDSAFRPPPINVRSSPPRTSVADQATNAPPPYLNTGVPPPYVDLEPRTT